MEIACVVTNAVITKMQAKRLALMANDGLSHAMRDITEIGTVAADCLARAIARGVCEARALPYPNALPSWRDRFGAR